MKRNSIIMLIIIIALFFTACSNKNSNDLVKSENGKPITTPSDDQIIQDISKSNDIVDDSNVQAMHFITRYPKLSDYSSLIGEINTFPDKGIFGYDIRSADLTNIDLSLEYNKLINSTFDSKTIWPTTLPKGFNPSDLMELYKNPGLNIKSLQKEGITGIGIGIGIIDQPILIDHVEYKNQIKYYSERESIKYEHASMSGTAVASIAVGNTVGVAPEADLYYIAEDFSAIDKDNSLLAESVNQLLDLNKALPKENKIRIIAIAWGGESKSNKGYKQLIKAYDRAKNEGVFVLTTSISDRDDMEYFGLEKIPNSNADDFKSYINYKQGSNNKTYNISVPMNFRCTASPTGNQDYVVYSIGGKSWATAYIAGLYALSCQIRPSINYKEFWQIASKTSRNITGEYNGKRYETKFIVDPVALFNELTK
jgi:subtilisin family serine protease